MLCQAIQPAVTITVKGALEHSLEEELSRPARAASLRKQSGNGGRRTTSPYGTSSRHLRPLCFPMSIAPYLRSVSFVRYTSYLYTCALEYCRDSISGGQSPRSLLRLLGAVIVARMS